MVKKLSVSRLKMASEKKEKYNNAGSKSLSELIIT
jgi:hypothetical protein